VTGAPAACVPKSRLPSEEATSRMSPSTSDRDHTMGRVEATIPTSAWPGASTFGGVRAHRTALDWKRPKDQNGLHPRERKK